jgi:ElaB/YqjD/DUF883 family membrane-anchored ribosome-binding protein
MGEGPKDLRSDTTSAETSGIRAEIERKRADISGTLDEIQDRFTPRRLVSTATDSVRRVATAGVRQVSDAAGSAADSVVASTKRAAWNTAGQALEHPWVTAAAVTGIGAASWWLANRPRAVRDDADSGDYSEESLYFDDFDDLEYGNGSAVARAAAIPVVLAGAGLAWWALARRSQPHASNSERESFDSSWNGGAYGSAGADAASYHAFDDEGAVHRLGRGAGVRMRGAVSDAAARARHVAAATGERTRAIADRAQHRIAESGRRASSQFARWVDANPLGAGGIAVLLGVAIGLAIPETDRERRLMGTARDRLIAQARRAAGDAVERTKQTFVDAATQRRRA